MHQHLDMLVTAVSVVYCCRIILAHASKQQEQQGHDSIAATSFCPENV